MKFKKGEGGRPKGVLNKATREIKDFARKFLESPDYVDGMKRRVIAGRAPHVEVLLFHYGYGKPKETVALEGKIPPFVLKLDGD
jgi:hypothetical protein